MHPELFCMAHLANIEHFLAILTFHLKYQILCVSKLASLIWQKSNHVREGAFPFENE